MENWNAKLFYKTELLLGEAPHWHPEWKKFLFVDIEGRKIGCIDPVTRIVNERGFDRMVGTVVPSLDGKLIVAFKDSIEELDFGIGELKEMIKIEENKFNNRCNEGKCDAKGRLWLGTLNMEDKAQEGALYCFDGSLKKKLDKISVSNGICWAANNQTMYYIDSYDYNIKAYDFDLNEGNITNEQIIVEGMEPGFIPDGMTIDEEGMLWVAMWGGSCVHRYDPANGCLIGKIHVPAPNVTSCAFGGKDMKTLLITTARSGLDNEQLRQFPLSGSLFYINSNVKGAEMNSFILRGNE
ncbi:MAG: SMP-30/gluconolactonase/LRE family protein [Mucilaginibacter sp.]